MLGHFFHHAFSSNTRLGFSLSSALPKEGYSALELLFFSSGRDEDAGILEDDDEAPWIFHGNSMLTRFPWGFNDVVMSRGGVCPKTVLRGGRIVLWGAGQLSNHQLQDQKQGSNCRAILSTLGHQSRTEITHNRLLTSRRLAPWDTISPPATTNPTLT